MEREWPDASPDISYPASRKRWSTWSVARSASRPTSWLAGFSWRLSGSSSRGTAGFLERLSPASGFVELALPAQRVGQSGETRFPSQRAVGPQLSVHGQCFEEHWLCGGRILASQQQRAEIAQGLGQARMRCAIQFSLERQRVTAEGFRVRQIPAALAQGGQAEQGGDDIRVRA